MKVTLTLSHNGTIVVFDKVTRITEAYNVTTKTVNYVFQMGVTKWKQINKLDVDHFTIEGD